MANILIKQGKEIAGSSLVNPSTKADKADLSSIVQTGTTSTQVISYGTYFYLNDVLVRARVDIANGATFTLNTNYEVVTAGALNALNSILSKIGSEIKTLNITGTTGTGSGAGNLVLYKSSYPGVKCLIPVGVSGGQYRAQISGDTSTYWVISVNNALTGAWAEGVSVTILTIAVMS